MNRSQDYFVGLVHKLRAQSRETEWVEFKQNRVEPHELGQYLSALSNSAAWKRKPMGYLVFGIEDETKDVVGTSFDPYDTKAKGNQDLLIWLNTGLNPNPGFDVEVVDHPQGRVVVFSVRPAKGLPVYFLDKAFVRVGTSKTELRRHAEALRAIITSDLDWSAELCDGAAIEDLDPTAIVKAREQYKVKNATQSANVNAWNDTDFLNKAKLTIRGAVTNTALLLLGREESTSLLTPATAKISWILKDGKNRELDYEHFGPPFLLQVERVIHKIRNLTLRAMPSGTLFPREFTQYDTWVLREALHNCIAHQDYALHGRINVVETPGAVMLTNVGDFLPGDVETVIRQDAPQETYRNPYLAEAMVNLNMIDTQGGGIKRMYVLQADRFFPLPDYDLTDPTRVAVTIRGEILDERYCRLLMDRTDLDLEEIILLDKVQKKIRIPRDDHQRLKKQGLVEGRYPNLFVASAVARLTGQPARHIRDRGFDTAYYMDLILELVREYGPVSRKDVNSLLMDKLPEVLSPEQKESKVHNMLSALSRSGRIKNHGSRRYPRWMVVK